MAQKYEIHKAAGIIIRDRKLLVEKSCDEEFYKAPGGSIDPGETPKQALVRELMEEFRITVAEDDLEDFGVFCHLAAGLAGKNVCMEVFMVKKWTGEPRPDNEVEQIKWVTSELPEGIKVGSIFKDEVIPRLKQKGLID